MRLLLSLIPARYRYSLSFPLELEPAFVDCTDLFARGCEGRGTRIADPLTGLGRDMAGRYIGVRLNSAQR